MRDGPAFYFERDFLTDQAVINPLGEFRLFDGTRITFYFTPKGLVAKINLPKEEEALKLSRELLDDDRVKAIFFKSIDKVQF